MSDYVIELILTVFLIIVFLLTIPFAIYKLREQEFNHQIKLQKAKHGIFDDTPNKNFSFKALLQEHLLGFIIALIITIVIVLICFIFDIPKEITRYLIEVIK